MVQPDRAVICGQAGEGGLRFQRASITHCLSGDLADTRLGLSSEGFEVQPRPRSKVACTSCAQLSIGF